ncbi:MULTISPECIES: GSU3473 family protein [Geobacter]|uniref:GSU3473 family protein n=1 Tax=Geobacter TaxID=28231 RepID=UPI002B2B4FA9|nr:hypothetical protein GSUET_27830 [Geobacter sulfurreducens subsp. ethanolicus]BET59020.1 hypothetical protein GEO60473_20600 [Geobacter sp. 60473]
MLIRVQYPDGRYDYVKHTRLDDLIDSVQISRFLRSSGWVVIGEDPVRRRGNRAPYVGTERRLAA